MFPLAGGLGPLGLSKSSGAISGLWCLHASAGIAANQQYDPGVCCNDLIVASGHTLTISAVAIYTNNGGASNGLACRLSLWDVGSSARLLLVNFYSADSAGWPLVEGSFRSQEITPLALGAGTYRVGAHHIDDNFNAGFMGAPPAATPETYSGFVTYGNAYYAESTDDSVIPSGNAGAAFNPFFLGAIVRGTIA